ncbi:unnamed protein product [Nippostrongylus brasiliensis]|uniref:Uncharacterized protein n=1 Tax=Nippostrongylus brasiliensis TaxID=27835 RepID=A0A0N4XV43_NIPBR|nr:hypothetical protein Q1695_001253 [Nippostrongylus brasiliensis]VDL70225.1 unnamed protein product [Nippostrongylus brasiliensis]
MTLSVPECTEMNRTRIGMGSQRKMSLGSSPLLANGRRTPPPSRRTSIAGTFGEWRAYEHKSSQDIKLQSRAAGLVPLAEKAASKGLLPALFLSDVRAYEAELLVFASLSGGLFTASRCSLEKGGKGRLLSVKRHRITNEAQ